MAISEFEIKRCERELEKFLVKRRPPSHIRNEVDLRYRIEDQSITIFEIRHELRDPKTSIEIPVAKTTYVKSKKTWKVFWQRADLKWHNYRPVPIVKSIEEFLRVIDEDPHHCFFG